MVEPIKVFINRDQDQDGSYIHNFGDELGAEILRKLGYEIEEAEYEDADILPIGTTLFSNRKLKPSCKVWGAGTWDYTFINDRIPQILAVRGRLTEKALQLPTTTIKGDTGLLASRFWKASKKKHRLGVVKHYMDTNHYQFADTEIWTTNPVDQVIAEITACQTIATSSLHGAVIAQAFGIPWVRLVADPTARDFKWLDFISALDKPLKHIQDDLLNALVEGIDQP
jgi:pyruvyltransferase